MVVLQLPEVQALPFHFQIQVMGARRTGQHRFALGPDGPPHVPAAKLDLRCFKLLSEKSANPGGEQYRALELFETESQGRGDRERLFQFD